MRVYFSALTRAAVFAVVSSVPGEDEPATDNGGTPIAGVRVPAPTIDGLMRAVTSTVVCASPEDDAANELATDNDKEGISTAEVCGPTPVTATVGPAALATGVRAPVPAAGRSKSTGMPAVVCAAPEGDAANEPVTDNDKEGISKAEVCGLTPATATVGAAALAKTGARRVNLRDPDALREIVD